MLKIRIPNSIIKSISGVSNCMQVCTGKKEKIFIACMNSKAIENLFTSYFYLLWFLITCSLWNVFSESSVVVDDKHTSSENSSQLDDSGIGNELEVADSLNTEIQDNSPSCPIKVKSILFY